MKTYTPILNEAGSSRLQHMLEQYVAKGKMAGAVAIVAGPEGAAPPGSDPTGDDDDATVISTGVQDLASDVSMGPDTIFRIYSLTKPVTSVAALMLVERGLLALDDAVADYIPAFADVEVLVSSDGPLQTEAPVLPPTIRDLFMHTSGIGGTHVAPDDPLADAYRAGRFDDRDQTLEQLADKLAQIPLYFQPGHAWRYGLSSDVLARVVEIVSGETFGDFLQKNIFAPLGMRDTGFSAAPEQCHRLATMYTPTIRSGGHRADDPDAAGELRPLHGLGADAFCTPPRLEAGGSGLVSTPRDYLAFARMLLGRGTGRGRRLLHPETVDLLATNQLSSSLLPYRLPWSHAGHFTAGAGFGLGVRVLLDAEPAGVPGSVGEYGWAGAGNTFLWVDPAQDMVLLLFTQAFPFLHTDIDKQFKRIVHEHLQRQR